MKHNVVIIGLIPPPYSGPEIDTTNILNSMILKNTFNLFHLNTRKHASFDQRGSLSFKSVLRELHNMFKLSLLIIKVHPKIVYIPFCQTDIGVIRDSLFILTSKVFRRKVVLSLPNGSYDIFYKRSKFPAYISFLLKLADVIIVLTPSVKSQIETIISQRNSKKVRILPLDIDLPVPSSKYEEAENGYFRVLHLGHISVAKGAVDLVRAIPDIVSKVPKTKFVFAGQFINNEVNIAFLPDAHNAAKTIETFIKENGIQDYVEFIGVVDGSDKSSLLENSDVQVLASYSEGLPRAILEGMLMGTAVVVTKLDGLKQVVVDGEGGLLVDFGCPKQIAHCICRLLSDTQLRDTMGKRNRTFVEKHFDPSIRFKMLSDMFESIIE